MKQTTVVTVYILTLSLCLVWCACPAHAETRHIALIHSFEPGYPPATKALELLQKDFRRLGLDCDVREYYLDCDRYMEVWNNVFSQFDNDGHGNYTELAQKNIDTGMGLERLAVVCQDVDSLFDVDTVMNITHKVTELTGATYGQSVKMDVSLRVITDHIRASTFMIADGVLPSNEGRGYVLRRLLRRAARHGKLLGVNHPFLYQIVETVVEENEVHYTYLRERCDYITKVVKVEEENFARTIDGGMAIFSNMLAEHKAKGETEFSGADAFKLYDTYGFPIDLTLEMVADEDMTLNQAAFAQLMQEQKVRAREARKALGDLAWAGIDLGLDNTPTTFVGYTQNNCDAKVLAVCVGDEVSGTIAGGEKGIIVLDKTPFYAEMGGQIADHGVILMGNSRFVVSDVQKDKGGKYLHHGKMVTGSIKVDDIVVASIDVERRKAIMRAHSATHLLQKALQTVLGDHVHQAGSYVEPDRLRFDFTHFAALTAEELAGCRRTACDCRLGFGCRLGSRADQTEVMRKCRAEQHAEENAADDATDGELERHADTFRKQRPVFG